jgi:glucokinase
VSLAIGVDIGGTKTVVGLVSPGGTVLRSRVMPTPSQDPDALYSVVADAVKQVAAADAEAIVGVGIGVAGLVDAEGRTVVFAPHLAWRGHDVATRFESMTGFPVEVDNDVAATAWAEYVFGAGRGSDPLLVVTVGTGLGGGIVVGGELMRGFTGASGEVGHVPFVPDGRPCACGANGCWEQYASGTALTRSARALVASGDPAGSALSRACGGDPEQLDGPMVTRLALEGDPASIEVIAQIGGLLGEGLAGVVAILDPQRVVVGGGAAQAGDLLLQPAREALAARLIGAAYRAVPPIVAAECGEQAAMIGAAELARKRFGST